MKLISYILTMLLCFGLASCRDDSGPESTVAPLMDLATFMGNNATGAVFEVQRTDETPVITLQATDGTVDDAEAGARMLIYYLPQGSGNISLQSASRINTMEIETLPMSKLSGWDRTPVYVVALWRTAGWINLHCKLTYSYQSRRFGLAVDEATADDPRPVAYLVHDTDGWELFDRVYYASFRLDAFRDAHPQAQGLTIKVNNANLDIDSFDINF